MSVCRIVLVDDHRVVIEGMRALFALRADMSIVGEASNGQQALELVRTLQPDIVIMDISMPHMSGVEAAHAILGSNPQVRIIMYTMHSDQRFILELYRTGIAGLVLKEDDPQELVSAVDIVRQGGLAYGRYDPKALLRELLHTTADATEGERINALSQREKEVFRLLADGLSIKRVAEQLHISPKTVETHKYNVIEKLQVSSLADLTKLALRHGLITA